ncbi:MAG: DUF4386 domain-containing protein [Myxococcaceae bacterium]|nr:DUF4386 domain-containing protein [Myxococcaceae bacterium]
MRPRAAGLLYLFIAVLAPFSMLLVPSRITTTAQLFEHAALYRAGMAVDVVISSLEVVLTVLLYGLFEQVSRPLALSAAFSRLAMAVLQGANVAVAAAALRTPELAPQVFALHLDVTLVWQVFFGLHCALLAVLIWRSGFVPPVLGPLMAVAAAGYLSDALGRLLVPGYGDVLGWVVGPTALIGEVSFMVWLLAQKREPTLRKKVACPLFCAV